MASFGSKFSFVYLRGSNTFLSIFKRLWERQIRHSLRRIYIWHETTNHDYPFYFFNIEWKQKKSIIHCQLDSELVLDFSPLVFIFLPHTHKPPKQTHTNIPDPIIFLESFLFDALRMFWVEGLLTPCDLVNMWLNQSRGQFGSVCL